MSCWSLNTRFRGKEKHRDGLAYDDTGPVGCTGNQRIALGAIPGNCRLRALCGNRVVLPGISRICGFLCAPCSSIGSDIRGCSRLALAFSEECRRRCLAVSGPRRCCVSCLHPWRRSLHLVSLFRQWRKGFHRDRAAAPEASSIRSPMCVGDACSRFRWAR